MREAIEAEVGTDATTRQKLTRRADVDDSDTSIGKARCLKRQAALALAGASENDDDFPLYKL